MAYGFDYLMAKRKPPCRVVDSKNKRRKRERKKLSEIQAIFYVILRLPKEYAYIRARTQSL